MSTNLTGSARKVKDGAADLHNVIQKWSKFNAESLNIINEIANVKLKILFESETEEKEEKSLSIPQELEQHCVDLASYLEKFVKIVKKMESIAQMFSGIKELEQHNNKEASVILFKTWPVDLYEKKMMEILNMFKKELETKTAIAENICHVKDRNTMMFYTASWLHQPFIEPSHLLILDGMLLETGHK